MQVEFNSNIMNEEFLHYLWKYRLLEPDLWTVSGEPLVVLHPGEQNTDGGPDFFNARIRLGGTIWAGNVEIHVNSSDWFRHKHQNDPAYDNVILHAVFENDAEVTLRENKELPTLVMKGTFPDTIYDRYRNFLDNRRWIPCAAVIGSMDPFLFEQYLPVVAVERLEERTRILKHSLEACQYDWDEAFYRNLARAFGFRINSEPFEMLAKSLPWKTLQKYRTNLFRLEALFFGQAGMLERNFTEVYPLLLQEEYRFMKEKHGLKPVPPGIWKFLRLRPGNFPTIRIAQLAGLIHQSDDLFGAVLRTNDPGELTDLFDVEASSFWSEHFIFEKLSVKNPKNLGISAARLLIVNLVVPFLFLYGEMKAQPACKEKGLSLLELLPAELNSEITKWKETGIPVTDALHSQALLHLKGNYCDKKKCLECRIGRHLLSSETTKIISGL